MAGTIRFKFPRKTAAAWTSANPVLLDGEMGLETDTRKTKFGDGTTAWNSLAYAAGGGSGPADTDALTEGVTNLYFTAARVRAAVLTGISFATGTAVVAADTVLEAFGKLQKQITDVIAASVTLAGTQTITGDKTFSGAVSVSDVSITITDNLDPTKIAKFQLGNLSPSTTRTMTMPDTGGTFAFINAAQTFTAAQTFSSVVNTFGSSTDTSNAGLSTGATIATKTKTVDIGTNGVSGSTTNITIGSTFGTTTTINGTLVLPANQALTGAPTAPTAAVGTKTTQIATTAFVDALLYATDNAQSGSSYTLALTDYNKELSVTGAGVAVTIPLNATVAFPVGTRIAIWNDSTGSHTIIGASGVTLNGISAGTPTGALTVNTSGNRGGVLLRKTATNTWTVTGSIGAVV